MKKILIIILIFFYLQKHAEHDIHNESMLSEGHAEEDDMYEMSSEDICPHNSEKFMNLVNKVLFNIHDIL